MDWNRILFKGLMWILDITRGMAVIAFGIIFYLTVFGEMDQEVFLVLDRSYNLGFNMPEENMFAGIEQVASVRPAGYNISYRISKELEWLYLLVVAITVVVYIYFATLLHRFVRSSYEGNFFLRANIIRLRIIGVLVMSVDVLVWLFSRISRILIETVIDKSLPDSLVRVTLLPDLTNSTLVWGILILVVAQAFDHGLKLKEEQELTI